MIDFSAMSGLASHPLRWLAHAVPAEAVVYVLQGRLRGAKWVAGSSTAGCWLGSYETDVQERLASLLEPGATFYDVGANVGFFSLLAARLVGSGGRVFAFEPLPRNLAHLRRHVALNAASQVDVVEAAVSDRAGTAYLDGIAATAHLSETGAVEVETVALDDLLCDGRLAPPSVVKIDVEGAEYAALRGMRRVLETARPHVLLELHGAWTDGLDVDTACVKLLGDLGYDVSRNRREVYARPAPNAAPAADRSEP